MNSKVHQICPVLQDAVAILVRVAPDASEESKKELEETLSKLKKPTIVVEGNVMFHALDPEILARSNLYPAFHIFNPTSGEVGWDAHVRSCATAEKAVKHMNDTINRFGSAQLVMPGGFTATFDEPITSESLSEHV